MVDKTLHFQGDLWLQERNGEWYIEDRQSGELSGPVNIGNLKTDSGQFGEVSVGNTGPVTSIGGDSGDLDPLYHATVTNRETFSNTSWGYYIAAGETPTFSPTRLTKDIYSDYKLGFSVDMGRADGDASATSTIRVRDKPETELSVTGVDRIVHQARSGLFDMPYIGMSGEVERVPLMQYKTDKGTAQMNNITWHIYGVLK